MANTPTMRDRIRQVLDQAEDSLTARQVFDELALLSAAPANCSSVASSLRTGELEGMFVRNDGRDFVRWTNNPEWTSKVKRKSPAAVKPQTNVEPAVQLGPPNLQVRPGHLPAPPIDPPGDDEPPIDSLAEVLTTLPSLIASQMAETLIRPVLPFALLERLDAIAQDLQEAVEDACKAEVAHQVIAQLVIASGATQRAARKLVA